MDIDVVNMKEDLKTALHAACDNKNHDALDLLLAKNGIDVNVKNNIGRTPLHIACSRNNLPAVTKLLNRPEIEINASSNYGWTPLHIACSNGNNLQVAAKLLDSPGIDVNIKAFNGRTPLHLACRKNLHTLVRKLLASPGIDVNARDVQGHTPVMESAECFKEAFNVMLEDTRVNLDIKDDKGRRLEEKVRSSIFISKERNELEEEQTLDKKILAKKHKEESSLLEKNQRRAISVLQKTSAREDDDEQRYIAHLKEHRDAQTQELEKLTNDAGNEASKPDESSKLEPIKRSLECPVCMELMRPPAKIWMCSFTHVICEVCKDRLEADGGKCPTCTTEPFIGRNYMAENLARTVFDD